MADSSDITKIDFRIARRNLVGLSFAIIVYTLSGGKLEGLNLIGGTVSFENILIVEAAAIFLLLWFAYQYWFSYRDLSNEFNMQCYKHVVQHSKVGEEIREIAKDNVTTDESEYEFEGTYIDHSQHAPNYSIPPKNRLMFFNVQILVPQRSQGVKVIESHKSYNIEIHLTNKQNSWLLYESILFKFSQPSWSILQLPHWIFFFSLCTVWWRIWPIA
jgi:hypothetical protein